MSMKHNTFEALFKQATKEAPFPYQSSFATAKDLFELVNAPTGAGKTATIVLGWLWRRRYAPEEEVRAATPRRLIYCLPMRVLVEQTRDAAMTWLDNLGVKNEIMVHVLMGGEDTDDWDLSPEADAVLIGTQDMLLSRALNRGYGMSRFRWPMHYGLLNNDCLWVLDEIQLMGVGLATSAQLQAFRQRLGSFGDAKTIWMSATLLPTWLETVDFRERVPSLSTLRLSRPDYSADGLRERWVAKKPVDKAKPRADEPAAVAALVKEQHAKDSLTLVVVNTVNRSREIYQEIRKLYEPSRPKGRGRRSQHVETVKSAPEIRLIHSHFRPLERAGWLGEPKKPGWLRLPTPPEGRVIVSTQVIEAGVDISARTLITELAPWPSLVQRFGRCNRRGEFTKTEPAQILWVDVPEKQSAPYEPEELDEARKHLKNLTDAGLKHLDDFFRQLSEKGRQRLFPYDPPHVIRKKDFVDLFDTTPDLAGNDIDVSRFIREGDDLDVQVFWREGPPRQGKLDSKEARRLAPDRRELCPVPVASFREFVEKAKKSVFHWDALDGEWKRAAVADLFPGQIFWVPQDEGGYSTELGWDPKTPRVDDVSPPDEELPETVEPAYDSDALSVFGWQSIAEHTNDVVAEMQDIASRLNFDGPFLNTLGVAVRWHDWGKAHDVFQSAIRDNEASGFERPPGWAGKRDVAKAKPEKFWGRCKRTLGERQVVIRHFRHELASALGVLTLVRKGGAPRGWADLEPVLQNLALYLIAAHHGKVRLSIRSMPEETKPPDPDTLFARGVWHGDSLPAVSLGNGVSAPDVVLDLSPMQLGCGGDGLPSWAERMLSLRDDPNFGPLRLAYLETILRAADMRASKKADEKRMEDTNE
jgi:CRISPR-associated endonuclease/helicase Cas3